MTLFCQFSLHGTFHTVHLQQYYSNTLMTQILKNAVFLVLHSKHFWQLQIWLSDSNPEITGLVNIICRTGSTWSGLLWSIKPGRSSVRQLRPPMIHFFWNFNILIKNIMFMHQQQGVRRIPLGSVMGYTSVTSQT